MSQVSVFAPSPQLTVTVEEVDGRPDVHLHPGGQGFWQARMITALGSRVTLCCALGGETGHVLRYLLAEHDIEVRARDVAARNGAYVHDRRDGERVEMVEQTPDPLTRHEQDDLYELAVVAGVEAGVAVLCGSVGDAAEEVVPVSVYERLSTDLARNGCRVVVDLTGPRLAATLAGTAPAVVKVSHEELVSDNRARSDSLDDLAKAAREILDHGVELVVVSRAEEPTLAIHGDKQVLVSPPSFEPVDTRGGGDSMTAGLAAALAQGKDTETALRLGGAAGAVNITRHGLGSGSGDAVRTLAERVEISPVG